MSTITNTVPTRLENWRQLSALAPFDMKVCSMVQMRPRTRRMTTTRRSNPTPPVGADPQLLLCDHRGNAPRSANTRITINMGPTMICSLSAIHEVVQPLPRLRHIDKPLHRNADRNSDVGIPAV